MTTLKSFQITVFSTKETKKKKKKNTKNISCNPGLKTEYTFFEKLFCSLFSLF